MFIIKEWSSAHGVFLVLLYTKKKPEEIISGLFTLHFSK